MRLARIRISLALAAASGGAAATQAASPSPVLAHPVAAASAASAASASSAVLSDACPAQLPVKQTVSGTIAGWTAQDQQGSYPFTRVAFYPGPPAESSLIVPAVEYQGQAGLHDRWSLPRRPDGYWMTCAYANTTATLARKLADDADYCQADYDGRFMTLVVRHWSCGPRRLVATPLPPRPATKPRAKPPVKRGG